MAEIKAGRALVNANRELITRFESKIQATLARIWGEEGADPPGLAPGVNKVEGNRWTAANPLAIDAEVTKVSE